MCWVWLLVHLIYRQPISIFSSLHPHGSAKLNKLEKLKRGRGGAIYWTKCDKVDSPSSIHPNVPEVNDMVGNGPRLILGPHLRLLGLVSLGKLRGIVLNGQIIWARKLCTVATSAFLNHASSPLRCCLPTSAMFNCTLLQAIASEMVGAVNWLNALSHPWV